MIDEIRYIFKMRIGCDGSRETLFIRNLIPDDQLKSLDVAQLKAENT